MPQGHTLVAKQPVHHEVQVQGHVAAIQQRTTSCRELQQTRQANLSPQRPADEDLAKLDSSVRKNAALARKLRMLTDATVESIQHDIQSLHQAKFLSEAVSAAVEAAHKPSRVPCVVKVRAAQSC